MCYRCISFIIKGCPSICWEVLYNNQNIYYINLLESKKSDFLKSGQMGFGSGIWICSVRHAPGGPQGPSNHSAGEEEERPGQISKKTLTSRPALYRPGVRSTLSSLQTTANTDIWLIKALHFGGFCFKPSICLQKKWQKHLSHYLSHTQNSFH